jgi:hypothetical protein
MSFSSLPDVFLLFFPFICFFPIFLLYQKRNKKPALISGRERLYCLGGPLKQQHMTYQIFGEAKRKFWKKMGIEMPFIFRLKRVKELLEIVYIQVNQAE